MIESGLMCKSSVRVCLENSAAAMGSGDMDVFATPAMVALMENAAMNAVASELPDGSSTVGVSINVTHVKPSAMNALVTASAELVSVEGRKLLFKVSAMDETGLIGEGTHLRCIVDRARFLAKL